LDEIPFHKEHGKEMAMTRKWICLLLIIGMMLIAGLPVSAETARNNPPEVRPYGATGAAYPPGASPTVSGSYRANAANNPETHTSWLGLVGILGLYGLMGGKRGRENP
jgi:hypothetical protein